MGGGGRVGNVGSPKGCSAKNSSDWSVLDGVIDDSDERDELSDKPLFRSVVVP